MVKKKYILIVFVIILIIFLFGFEIQSSWAVVSEQDNNVQILNGQTFGQSFTSLHAGLDGISIDIIPPDEGSNQVVVRLYENSLTRQLIFEEKQFIIYEPNQISYKFDLALQKNSYLRDYFLEVEWRGDQPLTVLTAPADSYDQGAFYMDASPLEAQLGFILHYDGFNKILGLAKQSLLWLWYLILTSLVFIVPGWALLHLTWSSWSGYDILVKIAMSAGVSFATYPLIMLLTDFMGFHPGELFYVWLPIIFGLGYLIWQNREHLQRVCKQPRAFFAQLKKQIRIQLSWINITTFIVVLLVIVLRLWIIRTLEVPLWGDSYQHTVITQLILDNKGLFESWLPYAPYESLSIHFGFHVNSAIFAWISNTSASYAVIWMGQIANIFAVLALYPLALRFSKDNKWMGCCVMFVCGLMLKLPMFYVNWGRYPQLLGQVLLLIATFMILETLFSSCRARLMSIICSIVLAGMALAYYRSPIFMIIFLPNIILESIRWMRNGSTKRDIWIRKSLLIIAFMALLLLPLLLKINQGELVDSVSYEQTSPLTGKLKGIISEWNNVDNYYRWIFFAVGAFAVLLGIFSKEWHIVLLPLGVLLLQSYAFGTFINLPFSNFIIVFSIVILLYIPLSFLMGYLFSKVAGFLDKYSNIIPALLLITFSLFFLYSNKNLINKKKYEYVTWADQRAFEWINENIGESARFLVDGFNIYNGTSSVGSDAGWWIPLLTERANTIPPQYALLNETPIDPNYSKNVVEIINTFTQTDPTTEEGISAMCQWGISHIYIGQKGGLMNQAQPLLNWHDWPDTSSLELLYAQDRVKIYAFDQNLCN